VNVAELLAHYGLALVFGNVLLERLGAPLPITPTLVAAGAFAAQGAFSPLAVASLALVGCLIGDGAWYTIGRVYGDRVMRLICSLSLSLDSCVRQTSIHFERWGGWTLVFGKFLPAVGTVAPPIAGVLGTSAPSFLALSTLGSVLYIGVAVGAGVLFQAQVDAILERVQRLGGGALLVIGALVGVYVTFKWWERQRLYKSLRMARITAEELQALIAAKKDPVIVDLRPQVERAHHGRSIPGAMPIDLAEVERQLERFPKDREIVFFCSCPNEASAASAAKLLMDLGYQHVRPLYGGIDAWSAAGYALEALA
jgi:membrane protein DedA with SNARE-associated domain/rhodanese-related sulfurtransferase